MFLLFMCVYALCMCLCLQRPEGTKSFRMELWTAVCPTVGASARAANALSLLTCPSLCQDTLRYIYGLHYFSVIGLLQKQQIPLCKYHSHFTSFVYYSRETHLKHVNVPELKYAHIHRCPPPQTPHTPRHIHTCTHARTQLYSQK